MRQLDLFPVRLRFVMLYADSPRKAWWSLALLEHNGKYFIEKKSGYSDKLMDRRKWPMKGFKTAIRTYDRKVNEKLNPKRKSPRKYQITCCND